MRAIVDVGRAAIRMAKLTMQMIERRRERGRGMRRGGEKNVRGEYEGGGGRDMGKRRRSGWVESREEKGKREEIHRVKVGRRAGEVAELL